MLTTVNVKSTSSMMLPNGCQSLVLPRLNSSTDNEHNALLPIAEKKITQPTIHLSKLNSIGHSKENVFDYQSGELSILCELTPAPQSYEWFFKEEKTHASVAKSIIQTHGKYLVWASDTKNWYRYDDLSGYWSYCDDVALGKLVLEELISLQDRACCNSELDSKKKVEWCTHLQKSNSSGFIKGVISLLASVSEINFKFSRLDSDPYLVGLSNRECLDLKTTNIRSTKSSDYLMKSIGISYDASATCSLWEKSVLEWCCADKERALFLQTLVGYSLSGLMTDQRLYFLYGNGKNGKSVFINILSALFGQNGLSIDPSSLMDLKRSSGQASGDIARLVGKRFISSNELPNNGMFNEELLKRVTVGDEVVARKLYGHDFQFSPMGKLFISGNNLPIIRGRDDGIWRRITLIPFDAKIAFPDGFLDQKLRKELTGILNWAIKGWEKFVKDGCELVTPAIIKNASLDYRKEMDLLTRWKDDCLQAVSDGKLSLSDIFGSYKNWCVRESILPMSSSSFNRETKNMFDKKRERAGNFVYGFSLNCGDVINFN